MAARRRGADFPGATGSSYTAVDADAGARLKVRVEYADDAPRDESLTSAATQRVAAASEGVGGGRAGARGGGREAGLRGDARPGVVGHGDGGLCDAGCVGEGGRGLRGEERDAALRAGRDGEEVKGGTRFTRTQSKAMRDANGGRLEAATGDVWRLRLGVEGSRRFALGADDAGATLTPRFEVGARLDGGDAETGAGADVGAGVTLAAPRRGLIAGAERAGTARARGVGLPRIGRERGRSPGTRGLRPSGDSR